MGLFLLFTYLFIYLLGNKEMIADQSSILNKYSVIRCTQAYSILENLFSGCLSGSITLKEVSIMESKKNKIMDLFSACYSLTDGEAHEQKKLNIERELNQCIEQANAFKRTKNLLSDFCNHLIRSAAPVEGKKKLSFYN